MDWLATGPAWWLGPRWSDWITSCSPNWLFRWRWLRYSRIAWKSVNGGDSNMKTSGQVTFKELPHEEVQVTVTLQYVPPAGAVGEAAVSLFGRPEHRLSEDLNRFKSFVEAKHKHALASA